MENNIFEIDPGLNLRSAKLISLFCSPIEHNIVVKIKAHDNKEIEIIFLDKIFVSCRKKSLITKLVENKRDNFFLESVIKKTYETPQEVFQEKLFQFLDVSGFPTLEIIAKGFICKI